MRISDWSSDVCSSDLSQRWKCRSCGSRFSAKGPTVGQKKPHENKLVFKLLVNKNSIRSIARVADLSPKAVYDKIDLIHRKCLRSEEHTSELQSLMRISYAVS